MLILDDAFGAALATATTFFISWILTAYQGIKISGISIDIKKQLLIYAILFLQSYIILTTKSLILAAIGLLLILLINVRTLIWARDKWKNIKKNVMYNKNI